MINNTVPCHSALDQDIKLSPTHSVQIALNENISWMPKIEKVKSKFPHFSELNLASNQMQIYHKVG